MLFVSQNVLITISCMTLDVKTYQLFLEFDLGFLSCRMCKFQTGE
jgi:hypothetical protein